MNVMDPSIAPLAVVGTAVIFLISAFVARAPVRRIVGAFGGAIPIVFLVMLYDRIAATLGLWHYPGVPIGSEPIAWYVASALFYGPTLGLVGWRIIRRLRTRGLVLFLICLGTFGVSRDYLYGATTYSIVFGLGLLSTFADFAAYTSAGALVQVLMYLICGSPYADRLARTRRVDSRDTH